MLPFSKLVYTFAACAAVWSIFVLEDAAMTAMRQAQWVPLENISHAVVKLGLLGAFAGAIPTWGIFVAWNAPLALMVVLVNLLVFARLIPEHRRRTVGTAPTDHAKSVASYAVANWGGTILTLLPLTVIPILVASRLGSSTERLLLRSVVDSHHTCVDCREHDYRADGRGRFRRHGAAAHRS